MPEPVNHSFEVIRKRIGIFPYISKGPDLDMADGEMIVFVSIGAGETHVSVLTDEAERRAQWTAVFGWGSLTEMDVLDGDVRIHMDDPEKIAKALRGKLRVYGRPVETGDFSKSARDHMRGAIGYILDQTIGDGSGYDRIILSAPEWLHAALEGCRTLRPHIVPEIQNL